MDEKVQMECIGIIGAFGIVALLIQQYNIALICVTGMIAFLSPKAVQQTQDAVALKTVATQATEDTPSDLSTDDLVSEVDNSISTTDTTTSTTTTASPILVPEPEITTTLTNGLSDEDISKIGDVVVEKVNAKLGLDANANANAETTVLTQ